ncbi:unnamed protein product [Vicia faba]|uniref:Aminotransferase-like plant mobile domain-containing protein n=1 Tax=Vicia faba TaxID=3906 RepID=A0AAV0YGP1_VICFA|nr:unnamed protein product [Vicia faba]
MVTCTEHLENLQNWTLDQRIKIRLEDTGFPRLSELAKCQHDSQLLKCVVSHFNTETCGFEFGGIKLVFGLKDVLEITGQSVTGTAGDMTYWSNQCFGQDLTFKKQRAIRGAIKLSVLREKFMEVPPRATEVELDRHTRAYALYVLGSSLFSSSSKGDVDTLHLPLLYHVEKIKDYAWGAAALAHLYCSMKKIKEEGKKHLHGIALSLQIFVFLHLTKIKDLLMLSSLDFVNEQLPLINDWSRHLEQFTLNKCKKVDYLDLISTTTAKEVNYNPYDNIQFPDLKEYSTFELERRVCCKSTIQPSFLINFNEVAFFQPHKFKKQYSNARAGDRKCTYKWKLYPRRGTKGKNWQETKKHTKYLKHWSISCFSKRPQPEEQQPERVQDVRTEEPIEVEHHNLDDVVDNQEKHCGRKRKSIWSSKENEVAHEEDAGDNNEDGGRNKDQGDTRQVEATCTRLSVSRVYIRRRKGSNTGKMKTSEDVTVGIKHSLYLLKELLPCLKQLSHEEMIEKEIEASRQRLLVSQLCIAELDDSGGDRVFCDKCKTSIFALHKHCQTCNSDFCLACCRDFCDAQLRGGADPIESHVTAKHGVHKRPRSDKHEDSDDRVCCDGFLELRSFYPPSHIADLVDEAKKFVDKYMHRMPVISDKTHKNLHSSLNRKAASRKESSDNDIYCPEAKNTCPEDLLHFQWHWRKGEPVIVRELLGGTYNSLWNPSSMSRAICQKHKTVKVLKPA